MWCAESASGIDPLRKCAQCEASIYKNSLAIEPILFTSTPLSSSMSPVQLNKVLCAGKPGSQRLPADEMSQKKGISTVLLTPSSVLVVTPNAL